MNNVITLTNLKSADENLQIIMRAQTESHRLFIHMSVALFQIREYKQYKALGFKNVEAFLDSQNVNISKAQFHDMASLGCALQWINTTEDELVACGYSSCKEIARLARSYGDAELNRATIASLITRRSKGTIGNDRVREEVVAALGLDKKSKPKADKATAHVQTLDNSSDTDGDDTPTESTDWRTKYKTALGKAKDEADFLAIMRELMGE
jgi:hypothetical protein